MKLLLQSAETWRWTAGVCSLTEFRSRGFPGQSNTATLLWLNIWMDFASPIPLNQQLPVCSVTFLHLFYWLLLNFQCKFLEQLWAVVAFSPCGGCQWQLLDYYHVCSLLNDRITQRFKYFDFFQHVLHHKAKTNIFIQFKFPRLVFLKSNQRVRWSCNFENVETLSIITSKCHWFFFSCIQVLS